MLINKDNLACLNNIVIESNIIKLCELNSEKDKIDEIIKIVENYSFTATLVLYKLFLKNPKQFSYNVQNYSPELQGLFQVFKIMNNKYSYFPDKYSMNMTDIRKLENIKKYIKDNIPCEQYYSPYGPIQQEPFAESNKTFKKSVDNFIHEAILSRSMKKRNIFRVGIELSNGKLIGCLTFDFKESSIDNYKTTGDIGLFINPENRDFDNANGKYWREALYCFTIFIERIYQFYFDVNESIYISATTHPFNYSTERIFENFKYTGIKNTIFGIRKYYVIPYQDFINTFKRKTGWCQDIQSRYVKATGKLDGNEITILP